MKAIARFWGAEGCSSDAKQPTNRPETQKTVGVVSKVDSVSRNFISEYFLVLNSNFVAEMCPSKMGSNDRIISIIQVGMVHTPPDRCPPQF